MNYSPVGRERDIVLAARRGDAGAFKEIYQAYRDPVWNLIVSLVGDASQAQDIIQNVFFKVFRGLESFRLESSLFTWIYRIAHNECLSHLRRHDGKHVPLEEILGSGAEVDESRPCGREDPRKEVLWRAIQHLPVKMREIIVLKYLEDLSYEEMSRVLGCPPGTVASRLARALVELEARLRPDEEESP